jgi:hypothetical protein
MVTGISLLAVNVPETREKRGDGIDWHGVRSQMREQVVRLKESVPWLRQNIGVLLILSAFFVSTLGRQVTNVLILFTSNKFRIPIDKVGLLCSARLG